LFAEITARIRNDFEKVIVDDLDYVACDVIFHSSSGNYRYKPESVKIMLVNRGSAKSEGAQDVEEVFDSTYAPKNLEDAELTVRQESQNRTITYTYKEYYATPTQHAAD
jgi:hypothetical protein